MFRHICGGQPLQLRCVETVSQWLSWSSPQRMKDGWLGGGMIEATETSGLIALIGVGHKARTSSPLWHDIKCWKLSPLMKCRWREGAISTSLKKKKSSIQTWREKWQHTHTNGDKLHRQKDDPRPDLSVRAASWPHCHNNRHLLIKPGSVSILLQPYQPRARL